MGVGELRRRAVLLPGALRAEVALPRRRRSLKVDAFGGRPTTQTMDSTLQSPSTASLDAHSPAHLPHCADIDGKQARRTGTSSPMGELFDHGLDTLKYVLPRSLILFLAPLISVRVAAHSVHSSKRRRWRSAHHRSRCSASSFRAGACTSCVACLPRSSFRLVCSLVVRTTQSTWEEYHTGTLYLGYVNGSVPFTFSATGRFADILLAQAC